MNLQVQRRIAADILKAGINRVSFDESRLNEIKEAITKADLRNLINDGAIILNQINGKSNFRSNKLKIQRRKGKRRGMGSRKGTKTARLTRKTTWMIKVRVQRKFIKLLKEKKYLSVQNYRIMYKMIKSNMFRSKRHLKLYLDENNLVTKKNAV